MANKPLNKPLEDLRHIAYTAIGPRPSTRPDGSQTLAGDGVQELMNEGAKKVGKGLWRGIVQVAAGGFGKGVLIAAAIILVGAALTFGVGWVEAAAPFTQGLSAGLSVGGQALTHPIGLIALAIGGTIGAVTETRAHQSRITAEIAQAEAASYQALRLQQLALEMEKQRLPQASVAAEPATPEPNFTAREAERRAEQTSLGR